MFHTDIGSEYDRMTKAAGWRREGPRVRAQPASTARGSRRREACDAPRPSSRSSTSSTHSWISRPGLAGLSPPFGGLRCAERNPMVFRCHKSALRPGLRPVAVSLVGAGFLATTRGRWARPTAAAGRPRCVLDARRRSRNRALRGGPLQVRRRPRRQGRLHAYLGARANETLAEVAVLDPVGRASFWVAQYGSLAHGSGSRFVAGRRARRQHLLLGVDRRETWRGSRRRRRWSLMLASTSRSSCRAVDSRGSRRRARRRLPRRRTARPRARRRAAAERSRTPPAPPRR